MEISADTIFLIAALIVVVRYVVDMVGRPFVEYYKLPSPILAVFALLVGLGLAFGINFELIQNGLAPWADKAVMGLLLGGGGGLLHDFLDALGYKQSKTTTKVF